MSDDGTVFDALDDILERSGPSAAIGRLVSEMEERGEPRPLLDALLLKARHDLGLPAVQAPALSDIAEPLRTQYEERYVEAIRHVGGKLLTNGDIVSAWPYFR